MSHWTWSTTCYLKMSNFQNKGKIEASNPSESTYKKFDRIEAVRILLFSGSSLYKTCPWSEFFWSVCSLIWTKYGEIRSLRGMRESADQIRTLFTQWSPWTNHLKLHSTVTHKQNVMQKEQLPIRRRIQNFVKLVLPLIIFANQFILEVWQSFGHA